jgi:tripartite ATP-independent transporter DctM subunit
MMRRGYHPSYASGVVVAAGTLGILIPPSVLLILYGFVAGISVPRLYAAAFVPGFTLAGLYVVYLLFRALRNPKIGPALPKAERNVSAGRILFLLLTGLVPIIVLILSVLGVIFFGIATPTEGASMGAMGGLVLAAANRKLSLTMLRETAYLTIRSAAVVGWLILGSSVFAAVFARLGGAQLIANFLLGIGLDQVAFVILVQILIFFLGWPLEWTEITLIFMPLFLPLLEAYKVDLVWFGVLAAVNMQTAFLSPPVAMSAYYLKNVAPKNVTLNQIFNGMYPYMGVQIAAMVLLYVFPDMALGLPRLIYDQPVGAQ